MFDTKFLIFACILVFFEMQTMLGSPTNVFGTAKLGSSTKSINRYVCLKRSDLDALETLASTGKIMARRQRRMGPEVLFEVE
uniref:Neuropeptide 31/32 n=1 Tax=Hymenolepis microstoma TaxID=85433 RepID=A0A1B1M0V4_HYMMI|nr:neuropeptide precursor 31/32 [Hymenolepis microstoma]